MTAIGITSCKNEPERLLDPTNPFAGKFGIAQRGAPHVDYRADPAQQFIACRRQQRVEVRAQLREFVRVFEQRQQPRRNEVARRVAAGVDEQQKEQLKVQIVELAAIHLRRE